MRKFFGEIGYQVMEETAPGFGKKRSLCGNITVIGCGENAGSTRQMK